MTHSTALNRTGRGSRRAAFSLVEVLLAVFILAIGIISIAALFPAGIAQQRLTNDDFMGPIVANHAMSIIRSKVSAEDFGTYEEFAQAGGFYDSAPQAYYSRTIPGDWGWTRPSFIWPSMAGTAQQLRGAIDIFSFWRVRQDYLGLPSFLSFDTTSEHYDPVSGSDGWPEDDIWNSIGGGAPPLHGVPFNLQKHYFNLPPADQTDPPLPPHRVITQAERYYPMQSSLLDEVGDRPEGPDYVWDCMFRRFQGRMYVAIFVYRVSTPQSGDVLYHVPPNPVDAQVPPLPFALDLRDANATDSAWNQASSVWYDADNPPERLRGPWDVPYEEVATGAYRPIPFVEGTMAGTEVNLTDPRQAWQEMRQWIIDQNNNVYRVLGTSREDFDADPVRVELSRPIMPVPVVNYGANTASPFGYGSPFDNLPLPTDTPYEYYADVFIDSVAYPPGTGDLPQPFFDNNTSFDRGVVTDLYYMPVEIEDADGNTIRITPVYATVKELS